MKSQHLSDSQALSISVALHCTGIWERFKIEREKYVLLFPEYLCSICIKVKLGIT